MKTFFLVAALGLFVAVQALTVEKKEKATSFDIECIKDTGVDKELIKKTSEGDWTTEDAKLKNFSYCMLKKTGLMTDDGKFHKEVALAKTEPEKRKGAEEAIDKCLIKKGATKEETAWNYTKCYNAKKPEHAVSKESKANKKN